MLYPRIWTRELLLQAALSATGSAAGLGVANLQDEDRGLVWRGPDGDYGRVDFDFGEVMAWNCLAIGGHSLSYGGGFEIWAGETPGGKEVLELNADAWEPQWALDEMPIDSHTIDGYPTEAERLSLYPAGNLRLIYLDEVVLSRYASVGLVGPVWASQWNPDGAVEAGVIIPGMYLEATRYISAPVQLGPETMSKGYYMEGGEHRRTPGPQHRAGTYRIAALSEGEVMGAWYDLLQILDTHQSFVADFFPGARSRALSIRNRLYCHLTRLDMPTIDKHGRGGITLTVRESH